MAILSTLIGLPVIILLGAVSLAGASVSGMATALTKMYQKKLAKVIKLVDIVTSASPVFEMSLSKTLNNSEFGEKEFQVFQDLNLKVINELFNVDRKMEVEKRTQLQKIVRRDKRDKENPKKKRRLMICSLFPVCYPVCTKMDKLQDIYY